MANIFDKWDKEINVEALKEEVAAIQDSNKEFEAAEHGEYEVKIGRMEVKATKKGDPMLSIWFKVVEDGKKHLSFNMNQVLVHKFSIKNAMDFLKGMKSNQEIKFESYSQFASLVDAVFNDIDGVYEYLVDYSENDKGFNTFKINDVFSV